MSLQNKGKIILPDVLLNRGEVDEISISNDVEKNLNLLDTESKNALISNIVLIIDQVKTPATEDSYTKSKVYDRILEELKSYRVIE